MKRPHPPVPALLIIVFFLTISLPSSAHQHISTSTNQPGWGSVDSLLALGQPRSALALVERIAAQAKAAHDDPEYLKTVIYRIRINSEFRENFWENTIRDLRAEAAAATFPVRPVVQSILAEVYWKSFQTNQYRIRNRTAIAGVVPDSVATWDAGTYVRAVARTYIESIAEGDSLKRIPMVRFKAILDMQIFEGEPKGVLLRDALAATPTLYDFLAGRVLDFFTSDEKAPVVAAQRFAVDLPWYFAQPKPFCMNRMMIPADTSAPASFALRIFRDLATFHLADADPLALVTTELRRFAFVYREYAAPGKDSLYRAALEQFDEAQKGSPAGTLVSFDRATFLRQQGAEYAPLRSDRHKWDVKSAVEVCDQAISRFPESLGAKNCSAMKKQMLEPALTVTAEWAVPAGKPSPVLITSRNLGHVYFRIVKTDPEKYAEQAATLDRAALFAWLAGLPVEHSADVDLLDDGDHQEHSLEAVLPGMTPGFRVLLCSDDKSFSDGKQAYAITPLRPTNISFVSKRNDDGSYGWFLLDRETGQPLKNAKAESWERSYNYRERSYTATLRATFTASAAGYVEIPPAEPGSNVSRYLKIFFRDEMLNTGNFYQYPAYRTPERAVLTTRFFTDRAIYRPGQTIYFKGIITETTGEETKIKANHSTTVVFNDANGQKIAERSLTTNEFGSFSGSFVAPLGVLPGMMTIYNETGSASVSVEEYRRPTFEVTADPLQGNYRLGEPLAVTGKVLTFAGTPVSGAVVKYRVVRTARFPFLDWFWRWPMPQSPETEIANGVVASSDTGTFRVPFTAWPDATLDQATSPVFEYTVTLDATDLNGETQSAVSHVSVGYQSLVLTCDVPELYDLSKDTTYRIGASNLNGVATPSKVRATLFRLRQPDRAFTERPWARPDRQLFSRNEYYALFPYLPFGDENNPETWEKGTPLFAAGLETGKDSLLTLLATAAKGLTPGSYLLTLEATDPFGQKTEWKRIFTAFRPDGSEVPSNALNWFVPLKTAGVPGEKASFLIGSKEDNLYVVQEVRVRDSLVSRTFLRFGDQSRLVEVPILERFRGDFNVSFLFVKHNRAFRNDATVTVPMKDKKLDIKFSVFRSKLTPGTRETWKLHLAAPGGKPAKAELLAAMYDASLDMFRANYWNFSLFERYNHTVPWEYSQSFGTESGGMSSPYGPDVFINVPELQLNWFGAGFFGNDRGYRRGAMKGRRWQMDTSPMMMEAAATTAIGEESPIPAPGAEQVADQIAAKSAGASEKPKAPVASVRRDFRETAFFYPTLETDSAGGVTIEFTVPESLTRWNLLGLATTKTLDYGLFRKEAVTQKELMVFPNAPRFVRQGDTLIFSTKIASMASVGLDGMVTLTLTDGLTGQPLAGMMANPARPSSKPFRVEAGGNTVVSWILAIPVRTDLSLLQYRVTATAGSFSDGEEKAIPVLTNRMMVTETLPLPVRGKGTENFEFTRLVKSPVAGTPGATLSNYRLTLEFASNPAWYAVQALPALNEKPYETANALFAAWFSNSLAAHIANSDPKIRAVFESWKRLTPDALRSNLEKNEELKSALLRETPWVRDAIDETARKRGLGLYFDPATIADNLRLNFGKLQKLQSPAGGWSWMEGMPESRFITQEIVLGMGKLHHLGVKEVSTDPAARAMALNALAWLDREMQKEYENIKKYAGKDLEANHTGSLEVQYLYARSFFMMDPAFDLPEQSAGFKEAFGYFRKQAARYWLQFDRYTQGIAALALSRLGEREVPALILKSLKEKALHSPEMGMYWAGTGGYSWYQAPVESQAMMIEVFDEVGKDTRSVEDLKIWLLKQKQTQDWRTPRATLEACYALLLRGTNLLSGDPGVTVRLGNQVIDPARLPDLQKEAGTGYFRMAWTGKEIEPAMGRVSVTKTGEGIAWGALYWQYFENLDKISQAASPLHVEKQVFVERNTAAGPVLVTGDTGGSGIQVGDKLKVRIVLRSDRDLEYVHMKDMRAAGLEPANLVSAGSPWRGATDGTTSGYRYQDGLGYYQSTTDEATNFFFESLPKGTWVFEYGLKANVSGDFSNGITSVQCLYAPEFAAHSEGIRLWIK